MARKIRWVRKVTQLLSKCGVSVSELPTNILFVSNSSVMCGVELETLESVFYAFDPKCNFVVYPRHKSYSFIVFSSAENAANALTTLNDTQPSGFPKEISLFFVTNLPKPEASSFQSKTLPGLKVIENFVNDDVEKCLIEFIESCASSYLKNRRVLHFGYHFNYTENNAFCLAQPIPQIFLNLIDKIVEEAYLFYPDQVTVNIYEAGQGIPPHIDTHSAFEEPIVSLSLISDVVMEFRDCANLRNIYSLFLPFQSLLVMTGAARYRYRHGKYDVNPVTNRLLNRRNRISITFRQVRRVPCVCPFVEFCDWHRSGKMAVPKSNLDGKKLESEYVSKVYEEIAEHFDETRRSNWGVVNKFLKNLAIASVVLDAGCGNGKYLIKHDNLCKIGGDICEKLVKIAFKKGCRVFCGDALALPIRAGSVDAVISIAVIHHFSTRERRIQALLEIQRVLRRGGRACVTVWAMEQQNETVYSKSRKLRNKIGSDDDLKIKNVDKSIQSLEVVIKKLRVHDGRSTFVQQDMLVPWNTKCNAEDTENGKNNHKQFLRYYHLFVEGELADLITQLSECKILQIELEEGNWAAVFEKI